MGESGDVPVLRARGLRFLHGGSGAGVGPLDLDVRAGEVVVVLGPNGSGKTTLLRLLATDLRADAGSLDLPGGPAVPPSATVRRRLSFVPDEAFHILPLTGRQNLAFFTALRGLSDPSRGPDGVSPGERSSLREGGGGRSGPLLKAFGLSEHLDRPVAEYSFGMRRKLLLVEALTAAPELLLADEPTIGLDPPAIAALRAAVAATAARGGTVVLASNEVREVPFWADRVLLLHRGVAVAEGEPSSLLARVHGRTRIAVTFRTGAGVDGDIWLDPVRSVPGLESARVLDGRLEAVSTAGGAPLPELLGILLAGGAEVRDIRLREPGLEDVFEALTGDRLIRREGDA